MWRPVFELIANSLTVRTWLVSSSKHGISTGTRRSTFLEDGCHYIKAASVTLHCRQYHPSIEVELYFYSLD